MRASPALVGSRMSPRWEFEALRCAMAQSELGPSNVPLKPLKNQVCKSVGQNNVFLEVLFGPLQEGLDVRVSGPRHRDLSIGGSRSSLSAWTPP